MRGARWATNQNSLTVGPRGPIVFEDFLLFEKMAHFNRRESGARGARKGLGAHGHFVCTSKEITKYTTAKLFSQVGQEDADLLRLLHGGWLRRVRRTRSASRGLR